MLCRICNKEATCFVAADGSHGVCASYGCWHVEQVSLDQVQLQPGPIQHMTLSDFQLDIIRWTHRVVGRCVAPNLELWEVGFMRDRAIGQELVLWLRIAYAFITYYRRRPARRSEDDGRIIGSLVQLSMRTAPENIEDGPFLLECYMNPDGWADERERTPILLASDNPRWSPLPQVAAWLAAINDSDPPMKGGETEQ